MEPQRILVQLDPDPHASVFDAVVAIDSDVQHLLQYSAVEPSAVRGLVHGAMFTRGPKELKHTALFVGGSNVAAGEALLKEITSAFFGPVRCSVMFDGNGSNTTAAAAVLSASRHVALAEARCLVLGGTGPVGSRAAQLLLAQGASVWLASRDRSKAETAGQAILAKLKSSKENVATASLTQRLIACSTDDRKLFQQALAEADILISAGAAAVQLIDAQALRQATELRVAIDLNAVPPEGIAGIGVMDKAVERDSRYDYGAIGVGGLKMKIHREAVRALFTRNDLVLDAEEIFAIGKTLV